MRVVVDTSVWVSAVLFPLGAAGRIAQAFRAGRFELVTSLPLLEELGHALMSRKITDKYRVTQGEVNDLLEFILSRCKLTSIAGDVLGCRDRADDKVIETAMRGAATVIVSSDHDLTQDEKVRDLLALANIRVLTVREFLSELGG